VQAVYGAGRILDSTVYLDEHRTFRHEVVDDVRQG